jgi:peptidoglycan/LPS O-acetylase OafA/YrhL
LFFAISGILICSRLLEEERRFGKISLRGFYIRRVCRIQPAAMLYLAVIGIMALLHRLPLTFGAFVSAALYFRNYYPFHGGINNATEFTNHFWSLSMEEHFYLFLPMFLVLCVKRRAMILAVIAGLLAAWNAIVTVTPALQFGPVLVWRTDVSLNEIVIPALIAILLGTPNIEQSAVKWVRPWSALLLAVALSVFAKVHMPALSTVAGILVYPLLLLGTMLHPQSYLTRFLELAPLRFIGRISFSLYLWQQLLFTGTYTGAPPLGLLAVFPLNFITVFALATLTYYAVEKPMIRLGHRLAPPASPGRSDIEKVF